MMGQVIESSCLAAMAEMKEQYIRNRMPITEVMFPNEEVLDDEGDENCGPDGEQPGAEGNSMP